MAVQSIYFLFISRNWFWLPLFFTLLSYAATVMITICPESPRWHLVNGRSHDGIRALNRIAQMNLTDERIAEDTIFVEDPTNFDVTVNAKTGLAHYGYSFTGAASADEEPISVDDILIEDELEFFEQM